MNSDAKSDYTPSTEQVRGAYTAWFECKCGDEPYYTVEEFDRWLDGVIDQARMNGYDSGYDAGYDSGLESGAYGE